VCDKLIEKGVDESELAAQRFVHQMNDSVFASARGQVFEQLAHRELEGQQTLKDVKNLCDQTVVDLVLGGRKRKRFKLAGDVGASEYGIPTSRTFAAVDSIAPPKIAFQMTLSRNHGISLTGVQKLQASLPTFESLVFVVPSEIRRNFNKQPFTTTKGQVAVRIPNRLRDLQQFVFGLDVGVSLRRQLRKKPSSEPAEGSEGDNATDKAKLAAEDDSGCDSSADQGDPEMPGPGRKRKQINQEGINKGKGGFDTAATDSPTWYLISWSHRPQDHLLGI